MTPKGWRDTFQRETRRIEQTAGASKGCEKRSRIHGRLHPTSLGKHGQYGDRRKEHQYNLGEEEPQPRPTGQSSTFFRFTPSTDGPLGCGSFDENTAIATHGPSTLRARTCCVSRTDVAMMEAIVVVMA